MEGIALKLSLSFYLHKPAYGIHRIAYFSKHSYSNFQRSLQ